MKAMHGKVRGMEYKISISTAMFGDVVPLFAVVEAMARGVATGHGQLPLHGPTLTAERQRVDARLLAAARRGELRVCDHSGVVGTVDAILAADIGAQMNQGSGIPETNYLHVMLAHLNAWGNEFGHTFKVQDTGVAVLDFDPSLDKKGKPLEIEGPDGERLDLRLPLDEFGQPGTRRGMVSAPVTPSHSCDTSTPNTDRTAARRARRYQMCIDAGMEMPENDYGRLPRGISELAKVEGVSRQSFSEDVKAHIRNVTKRR